MSFVFLFILVLLPFVVMIYLNGKAKKIGTKDLKIYAPSSEVGSVHLDRDGV